MQWVLWSLIAASIAGGLLLLWFTAEVWRGRAAAALQRYRARPQQFEVSRRIDHTDTLFSLVLTPIAGRRLRKARPGQYLTVLGPTLPAGTQAERRYSLSAWAADPRHYELCIRKEERGRVSHWLHEQARPGIHLQCRPPSGEFVMERRHLREPGLVLIAAGVGITPLKSMLEWLRHNQYRGQVTLFQCASDHPDLLYYDEFARMAGEWNALCYRPVLSRPTIPWPHIGRLTPAQAFAVGGAAGQYFFCTSQVMTDLFIEELAALGVPPANLHYELFAAQGGVCGPFTIGFDGREIEAEGYPNILCALETHGVSLPADCRAGDCGRCRLRVLKGQVTHHLRQPPDIAADECLPCVACPNEDVILARLGAQPV